jgi:glutamate--cysteine ligase catalytic subunit
MDDATNMDHFENIQSTNWQSVRFKPPPPGTSIGWRVEFRVMELQMTDFENAAFVVFNTLLVKLISHFDLNFYIPMSKVDENMTCAQSQNSVINGKFYFRKQLLEPSDPNFLVFYHQNEEPTGNDFEFVTVNHIINGSVSWLTTVKSTHSLSHYLTLFMLQTG